MKKKGLYIIAGLFFLGFVVWIIINELSLFNLEVVFFDVGQGDSILTEWMQYIPSYLGLNSLT